MKDRVFLTNATGTGVWAVVAEAIILHETRLAMGNLQVRRSMNLRKVDLQLFRSGLIIFGAFVQHLIKFGALKSIFSLKLGDLELGRYVTASALRDVDANRSKTRLYFRLLESLLRSVFVHAAAARISDELSSVFLGNVYYLDGIWIDFFLRQKGVTVYLDLDPHGLLCVEREFPNLSALQEHLASSDVIVEDEFDEARTYMTHRLDRPSEVIWYYSDASQPLISELDVKRDKVAVIVYAHSFTDAQLCFGIDGFLGVFDWLSFTLEELKGREDIDVFVKAHPNFFGESSASGIEEMDRKLWNHMVSKLRNHGFTIVDAAVPNSVFLSHFDVDRTVLISHHGNALVEGAFLGFRSIASRSGPWYESYNFVEVFSNVSTYSEILANVTSQARSSSPCEFQSCLRYISRFYLNPTGSLGSLYYPNLISAEADLSVRDLMTRPFNDLRASLKNPERLKEAICSSLKVVD